MQAMRFYQSKSVEEKPLEERSLPTPAPGKGQLLVKVTACGVCRTDLHITDGDIQPPHLPITLGHQVVGHVEDVGQGITGFSSGDLVGIPWLYSACGSCRFCNDGMENLCNNARFTGFHVDGGFAEYILADFRYTLPIPVQLEAFHAAPLLCAGIIGYRSLRVAGVEPGQRVGLFGFGASAHLSIQIARHWNCEVYVYTRSRKHREHAEILGASWIGGAEDISPKLLDRAVIFAPAGWIVHEALKKVKPGGTVAINAVHMSPIPEMPYKLIYGEKTLRSVANATYVDGLELLQLAVEIPIESTINYYDLTDVNTALTDIKFSRINGEAVVRM